MKTPASPIDIPRVFPFLAGRERTTWRLHPRAAPTPPPLFANKLGGGIAWPNGEELPRDPERGLGAVPVLQLRRDAETGMPFPDGTDLFQLLWFPAEYGSSYLPRLVARYRSLEQLANHRILEPSYPENDRGFRVSPCSISIERVIEYPYIASLSAGERDAIAAWEAARNEPTYQYLASTCPGTKIGGYPQYAGQDDFSPPAPWEYVLTISDDEWDAGSGPRWKPDGAEHRECAAIGTYLKNEVNVFVDRTQTPWRFMGAR